MHENQPTKSCKTSQLPPKSEISFEYKTRLTKHNNTKETGKTIDDVEMVGGHVCQICGRQNFQNIQEMNDHFKIHSEKKSTYSCSLCPPNDIMIFSKKIQLRIHERKVHQNHSTRHSSTTTNRLDKETKAEGSKHGPQICEYCHYECISRSALEKHRLTHTNERPHSCRQCGKKFVQSSHVNYHMKTVHAPPGTERPKHHVCGECGAKFSTASTLRKHSRTHTGKLFMLLLGFSAE